MKSLILALSAALACSGCAKTSVEAFDASRDAAADIAAAVSAAKGSGKRVLVEVGGDWCPWCRRMDPFLFKDPEIAGFRTQHFVTVKVYIGPDKNNAETLSAYGEIPGTPHFFVLGSDGALIIAQKSDDFEAGDSYDRVKLLDFLKAWAP